MLFKRQKNKANGKTHPYFVGNVNLLDQALQAHLLLNATTTTASGAQSASSILLDSSPEEGTITIDALSPIEKNKGLKPGSIIELNGSINGTNFSFHSAIKKILQDQDGNLSFQLRFPERLHSELQRDSFRVNVSVIKELKVLLFIDDDETLTGYLRDISATGFRVEFKGKPHKKFSSSDKISKCLIQLPDSTKVECQAKVMHVGYNPDLDIYKLGCKFTDIPGQGQRVINRFINNAQRELRRKEQGEDFV